MKNGSCFYRKTEAFITTHSKRDHVYEVLITPENRKLTQLRFSSFYRTSDEVHFKRCNQQTADAA